MTKIRAKTCYVTLDCGVRLAAESDAAVYSTVKVRFDAEVEVGTRIYTRKEVAAVCANLLLCRIIQGITEVTQDTVIELSGVAYEEPYQFLGCFKQPEVPGHFDPALHSVGVYMGPLSELKAAVARYLEILV